MEHSNQLAMSRIQQFDAKNGDDAIYHDGMLLFSNGAMRERYHYGVMIDPPKDEYERCKNVLRYHKVRLEWAVEKFRDMKLQLDQRARLSARDGWTPPPNENELAQLKELQADVKRKKALARKAEKAVVKNKPERLIIEERHADQTRQRAEEALAEISEIDV